VTAGRASWHEPLGARVNPASNSPQPSRSAHGHRSCSPTARPLTVKVASLCGRAACRFAPRPRSRPLTRTRSRTCFHAPDNSPPAHRPCGKRSDPQERSRSRPRPRRPSASRVGLGACAAESAAKRKQSAWRPASVARRFGDSQQLRRSRREHLKPVLVGDGDEEPNHGPRLVGSRAAGKVISYSRLQFSPKRCFAIEACSRSVQVIDHVPEPGFPTVGPPEIGSICLVIAQPSCGDLADAHGVELGEVARGMAVSR
jgi:hypothetical protein